MVYTYTEYKLVLYNNYSYVFTIVFDSSLLA